MSRANFILLAITALFCIGDAFCVLGTPSGMFGPDGFVVLQILMWAGLFLWLFLMAIAIDNKLFGWKALVVSSIAFWCTIAGTFWIWYWGMSSV